LHYNIKGAIAVVSLLTGNVATNFVSVDSGSSLNVTVNSSMTDTLLKTEKIKIITSLTLLVGLIQIIMGVSGLGILSTFFSDAFVSSYTCGSAIHVATSQIKSLLGIKKTKRFQGILNVPKTCYNLGENILSANWKTIIFSICCCVYLSLMKEVVNPRFKRRFKLDFPTEIILVRVSLFVN